MDNMTLNASLSGAYRPGQTYDPSTPMLNAINRLEKTPTVVQIVGDTAKLFRVVRQEDRKYAMATGKSAF